MGIAVESVEVTPTETKGSDYLRALGYLDVSIEVNDQCNFHCVYCPYDTDPNHEMSVLDQQKVEEIIDRLANDHALDGYLLFNVLGEPLMYSGICDVIKYANSSGLKTKLVTNGSLLTKKNIDALIDAVPTLFKISVESLDPEVFAELRGTTIKFDTYVKRIASMVACAIKAGADFKSYLQLDIMYDNPKLHALKRLCSLESADEGKRGTYTDKTKLFNDIQVFVQSLVDAGELPGVSTSNLNFNKSAFDDNEIPLLSLGQNIAFHIKNYVRWDDVFMKKYPVGNDGRGCDIPNLGIHASGEVALCCMDYNASTKLGNVFEQSLPDILTDPKNIKIIQDLRKGVYLFDACKSCQGHTTLVGKYAYGAVRRKTVRQVLGPVKRKIRAAIGK